MLYIATPVVSGIVFAPLNHHDYGMLDDSCVCSVCTDWRVKLHAYQASLQAVPHSPEERDDRGCNCSPECKASMKSRSAYLGALHRRNLYCESSWHASEMVPRAMGEEYMRWIQSTLEDRKEHTDGWWERCGSTFSMMYWLIMFRQSIMGSLTEIPSNNDLPKARMDLICAAASGII